MASSGAEAQQQHSEDRLIGSLEERLDSEDHESDDEMADPTEHDREILSEEEEREKLLGKLPSRGELKRTGNSSRGVRKRKKRQGAEKAELISEMEEGGLGNDTSSQSGSSSPELESEKQDDRRRKSVVILVISAIAILFCVLLFGAYRATSTSRRMPHVGGLLSNGSSTFAPTTILISLDGFRADFLRRGLTPTLNAFIAEGVSPKYMLPSFPSVTFPNHYTLVTGLYPESHGVVGNSFWDPELEEEFYYTDPARSMQPKWWLGGEPLWVTAEKQNVKTAIHMWPGSEAHITLEPSFLDKYNGTELLSRKVERILELLDIPSTGDDDEILQRPQFIAAYVPDVDAAGHLYGPNSTEIRAIITSVDDMLHDLFVGLNQRNLSDIVNIVVVSDHGMASTSTDRLVQLDDLIDLGLVEHVDGWPLYGLRPKDPIDLHHLYDILRAESMQSPTFDVYLRDQDMPERYHFSKNERIAPLWVIPKTGWAIVHKEDFDIKEAKLKGEVYHPKGLHGYDHEHPLMRAIFVARGPAFPHEPNSKLDVFQNTEVYNIICDSLAIEPKANNGTLRLPLKPIGFHLEHEYEENEEPQENQENQANINNQKDVLDEVQAQAPPPPASAFAAPASIVSATTASEATGNRTSTALPGTNRDQNHNKASDSNSNSTSNFWDYLSEKLEAMKAWAETKISHPTNNSTSARSSKLKNI